MQPGPQILFAFLRSWKKALFSAALRDGTNLDFAKYPPLLSGYYI